MLNRLPLLALILTLATSLVAGEHRGAVKSNGLPVPGAVVTASQGDRKETVATDENGNYQFANLPPGKWTVEVEMFGFSTLRREVEVSEAAAAAAVPITAPACPSPSPRTTC